MGVWGKNSLPSHADISNTDKFSNIILNIKFIIITTNLTRKFKFLEGVKLTVGEHQLPKILIFILKLEFYYQQQIWSVYLEMADRFYSFLRRMSSKYSSLHNHNLCQYFFQGKMVSHEKSGQFSSQFKQHKCFFWRKPLCLDLQKKCFTILSHMILKRCAFKSR